MAMRQLKIRLSFTDRGSLSLELYFKEVNKIPLISPEEEERLTKLIADGDKDAFEALVKANLRFVVSVAKQYQNMGLHLSDLINEGNLGLIKAATRFDPSRGFKFISFAVWWIRQHILEALANHGKVVRLPSNKIALTARIFQVRDVLTQTLDRTPSTDELAEAMELTKQEIETCIGAANEPVRLDSPITQDGEDTFLDMLTEPNDAGTDASLVYKESLQKEIARVLSLLTRRQREVICFYFGIGVDQSLGLDEIAAKFNLSRERVRQIKDGAIRKLVTNKKVRMLREYLGN